jgi:hypothetical protein
MALFPRVSTAREPWVERQRPRRRPPLLRLLDHSFGLRLLLAVLAAMVALGGVNRYAVCRERSFAPGCLWQDAGGVVEVANLEALSILTAAFLYVMEGTKRRQREHMEAYQVLVACRQAGVRYAPARNDAMERLCAAGLEFTGWDLSGIDLDQIQMSGAHWHGVILAGSTLREADLRRADLGEANLQGCDLSGTDLSGSDLRGADLRGAVLRGANLQAIRWDEHTQWPPAAHLAEARNLPRDRRFRPEA